MEKLAYTVKEAAEVTGISERTIYEMVYREQIPYKRLVCCGTKGQGKIIIPRKPLEMWLEQQETRLEAEMRSFRVAK